MGSRTIILATLWSAVITSLSAGLVLAVSISISLPIEDDDYDDGASIQAIGEVTTEKGDPAVSDVHLTVSTHEVPGTGLQTSSALADPYDGNTNPLSTKNSNPGLVAKASSGQPSQSEWDYYVRAQPANPSQGPLKDSNNEYIYDSVRIQIHKLAD